MEICDISPKKLAGLWSDHGTVDLIDVRTPVEFRESHAVPARNIPLDALDPKRVMDSRTQGHDEPLYIICRSGSRARQACEKFVAAGYDNVVNVTGGTLAWQEQGLPVVTGKKAISLERQVRIAAGLLVAISSVLAILVHPYFAGIAAFVGSGLVFAGITDTCGMGMVLARMPWNQCHQATDTVCVR